MHGALLEEGHNRLRLSQTCCRSNPVDTLNQLSRGTANCWKRHQERNCQHIPMFATRSQKTNLPDQHRRTNKPPEHIQSPRPRVAQHSNGTQISLSSSHAQFSSRALSHKLSTCCPEQAEEQRSGGGTDASDAPASGQRCEIEALPSREDSAGNGEPADAGTPSTTRTTSKKPRLSPVPQRSPGHHSIRSRT